LLSLSLEHGENEASKPETEARRKDCQSLQNYFGSDDTTEKRKLLNGKKGKSGRITREREEN
jgi:hypothetical protein